MKFNKSLYKKEIKKEKALWNKIASNEIKKMQPDYKYYKETIPYKIYRNNYVKKMLNKINKNDIVLELGCYNGWFTLEMARKGAKIDAYDFSTKAINIASKYYLKRKKVEKFTGRIKYHLQDLNYPFFQKNKYSKIVIRNVLHHLINLNYLYKELYSSLRKNGEILIEDALPCRKFEALITGILLFILPTDIPYSEKLKRIFKKGSILSRTQNLVDAKGSSPFESITGEEHLFYLKKYFVFKYKTFAAFVGTISSHLKIKNAKKIILLKIINKLDILLINLGLVRGTIYYLEGIKK